MVWNYVCRTGLDYLINPMIDTATAYLSSPKKEHPVLHPMITVIQLGEIWDREKEDLRVKFENNQIMFIPKTSSIFDFSRSRDDLIFLRAEVENALQMYPPTTEKLKVFYERAAKGLETLRQSYITHNNNKVEMVCDILNCMIDRIRNAVQGILSREERITLLCKSILEREATARKALYDLLSKKAGLDDNKENEKSNAAPAPAPAASASAPKKKGSSPSAATAATQPTPEQQLAVEILKIVAVDTTAAEREKKEFEQLTTTPKLSDAKQALQDKIKNIMNAAALDVFYASYAASKEAETPPPPVTAANGTVKITVVTASAASTAANPASSAATTEPDKKNIDSGIPVVVKVSENHLAAMRLNITTYVGLFNAAIKDAQSKLLH